MNLCSSTEPMYWLLQSSFVSSIVYSQKKRHFVKCKNLTVVTENLIGIISLIHLMLAEESTMGNILNLPERISQWL